MITITTINNSWYFLGNLVIKPNSSSTYQEENLSKNQAKDLLESVSSKRVNLSSEDLMKVQNRYNSFNSGGNVDLSGILSKIEEIYKDGGASGATLTNVEYNNGVFNYTNGTVNGYVGYTAVESISVVQSGTLTVSSIPAGVTYIAVISGNQVPNDFPSVLLILGDGTISVTQTTYPVSYGDTIEIQWTANSISALIGGQWVSSTIGNALNDPHLLVFSLSNTAPLYFSIPGFVPGSTRSGVLVEEIDERIQADLDITADISTVRTLAETNQLNIADLLTQINSGGSGSGGGSGANRYHAPDRLLMNFSTGPTDVYGSVWNNPDNCTFSGGALVKGPSQTGIHCGYCPALNFAFEDFTLDFWIKPYSYENLVASVIGSGQVSWQAGCCTVVLSPQGSIRLGTNTYSDIVVSPNGAVALNVYTHVRFTRASGVFQIFINGVFSASAYISANVSLNTYGTWIGQNGWDAKKGYFDGEIKDLRAVKGYAIPDSPFDPNIPAVLPLLF